MLSWEVLEQEIKKCDNCDLSLTKTKFVLGRGNRNADVMLVGEGPGREEDITGEPFVGAAGKLLDSLLCAIGFKEEDIYIANVVKCRPPDNRIPTDEESKACLPFLRNQAFLVKPKIIVCLGSTASKYILRDLSLKITKERGKIREKNGFYYLPTYHPAALLRDQTKKIDMYKDLIKVKELYEKLKEKKT